VYAGKRFEIENEKMMTDSSQTFLTNYQQLLRCDPQLLVLPVHMAEATIINEAMQGLGTKEKLLYPILCGRDNDEIVKLKETYFSMYTEDLGVKLAGELGGDFERMVFWSLQGLEKEYDEDYFTEEKAEEDADAFYEAGQGSFGTDEASIFKIIGESPPEHLEKVNEIYTNKREVTLLGALKTEVGGDAGKAARYAVGMKLKPFRTAAEHIEETCAGFGTGKFQVTHYLWPSYSGIILSPV
jgi:hypothetical protein